MRKLGTMLAALSLVAMAPSYAGKPAHKARAAKQISDVDTNTPFDGIHKKIIFVNNVKGYDEHNGRTPRTSVASIERGVELAGKGGVIYVEATKKPYLLKSTVTLEEGQALVGSCVGLKLEGKEIPALTPSSVPELHIDTPTGIAVTIGNQISGFRFTGETGAEVGIGSGLPEVSGHLLITKNAFTNLSLGIYLGPSAPGITLEILENFFSFTSTTYAYGFALFPKGVVVRISNNRFEEVGSASGMSRDSTKHLIGSAESESAVAINNCPCKPSSAKSSSRVNRSLESHYFFDGNRADGISSPSGSAGFTFGMKDFDTLSMKGNTLNGSLEPGACDIVMWVSLRNGSTGCVENNTFSHGNVGLYTIGRPAETGTTTPNCLRLIGNVGKNNSEADFQIDAQVPTDPSLLQAAIHRNKGKLEILSEIENVETCAKCVSSK